MRFETTRRKHCAKCGKLTVHFVTYYGDENREVSYCTECGT